MFVLEKMRATRMLHDLKGNPDALYFLNEFCDFHVIIKADSSDPQLYRKLFQTFQDSHITFRINEAFRINKGLLFCLRFGAILKQHRKRFW